MDDMKSLLSKKPIQDIAPPRGLQEWNDLVEWFYNAVLPTWNNAYGKLTVGRMRKKLEGLTTGDLRYMQSVYRDTERRNGNVAAAKQLFWSINPKKHDNDNKGEGHSSKV